MEDDEQHSLMGEEDYEDDVVDVLVNLPDLVDLGAAEKFPMTDEDYDILLADLEKKDIYYEEFPAFVVQQSQFKLRT